MLACQIIVIAGITSDHINLKSDIKRVIDLYLNHEHRLTEVLSFVYITF